MSRWHSVRLTSDSWEISRWLGEAVRCAFPSGYTGEAVRLGDVATVVPARERISTRRLVVSPSSVDHISGAVTRTKSGVVTTGCSLQGDLKFGDVLVPQYGSAPCVFVTPEHAHLAFSNFVPVRVNAKDLNASVLWAILTSTTGVRARGCENQNITHLQLRPVELLEFLVPRLSADDVLRSQIGLLLPSPAIEVVAPPVRPSDWACVELQSGDWWRPVATVGIPLETGPTLGEVADLVVGEVPREKPLAIEFPDSLPLADSKWVRTGRPTWWHAKRDVIAVESGAVVLAIEGRFCARIAEYEVGLDRGVIAMKLRPGRESISSATLAAYLNGDVAQVALAQLAKGTTIPRLSTDDLSDLRLPTERRLLSLAQISNAEAHPIADLLEDVLWNL